MQTAAPTTPPPPSSRWRVLAHEVHRTNAAWGHSARQNANAGLARCQRGIDALFGQPKPPAPQAALATRGLSSVVTTMRAAWQNEDYRRQFWGRMGTQCATGVYYGSSILLLNMYGGALRGSGSQLADNTIRMAELLCNQLGSIWRVDVEVDTRNQPAGGADLPPANRSVFAAALLYAWVGEIALAGCFLGAVFCRRAAWLTTRRMVLALGSLRVARTLLVQSQYANFDALKGLAGPTAGAAESRQGQYWGKTRWVEQTVGLVTNAATSLSMQYLPALVPGPAMLGLVVGLTAVSIGISLVSKLPMRHYLDEASAAT